MGAPSALMLQVFDMELLAAALDMSTRPTPPYVFFNDFLATRACASRAPRATPFCLVTAFAPDHKLHRPTLRSSSTLYGGLRRTFADG
ncbi:hypothetical protein EDB87DRAFT_1692754 [Lactarius vividus]|nr:hypothetical protein EDB87DRAFT_1692754 [Lactarius vividus]